MITIVIIQSLRFITAFVFISTSTKYVPLIRVNYLSMFVSFKSLFDYCFIPLDFNFEMELFQNAMDRQFLAHLSWKSTNSCLHTHVNTRHVYKQPIFNGKRKGIIKYNQLKFARCVMEKLFHAKVMMIDLTGFCVFRSFFSLFSFKHT